MQALPFIILGLDVILSIANITSFYEITIKNTVAKSNTR
jgi:hypothetical protein